MRRRVSGVKQSISDVYKARIDEIYVQLPLVFQELLLVSAETMALRSGVTRTLPSDHLKVT